MISSWSFSKRSDFDTCKKMFWLKHDQKIPEPPRILKPGQTEFANDRGSRVHENCEGYVQGDHDALAYEAEKYFGSEGKVMQEQEWGMSRDWEPAPWASAWLRLKLDALVFVDPTHAIAIDFKTGRKYGNEVKHAEQLILYQLCTFLRFPKLETVTAELWYFDQDEITSKTYTRSQGLRFKDNWNRKGSELLSCTEFKPASNKYSCRWCPYLDTPHCLDGVKP
jgi:hypothetical protein